MGRPGYGKEFWEKVRADYEAGENNMNWLAKKYGVAAVTVQRHRDKEGWVVGGATATVPSEATVAFEEPPTVTVVGGIEEEVVTEEAQRIAELEAKLTETETALAQAEAEARKHDPRVDVPHLNSPEAYLEYVGYEDLSELAMSSLALENVKRHREGKPSLEFGTDRIDQEIQRIITKRIQGLTGHVRGEDNMRVLKMVKPSGTMTQVPVETQINNEAGQQGAAVWKAREKGFKIAFPYRCQRHNCWNLSATDNAGNRTLDGYCSPEHRAGDPYINARPVAGISTSAGAMTSTRDSGRADEYLARPG